MLVVSGFLAWRAASLNNLPDVGDPFDVDAFLAAAPAEDRDAFTLYRKATAEHVEAGSMGLGVDPKLWEVDDWEAADPIVRRWAVANQVAFTLWMRGAERPEAQATDPATIGISTLLNDEQAIRQFARLAVLEGSRRLSEGDPAGAWEVYRGGLRASRHVQMRASIISRLIGAAMLRDLNGPVQGWMADPRVDAGLLRHALDDLRVIEAMTPPISEALKVEYLALIHEARRPDVYKSWSSETPNNPDGFIEYLPGYVPALWFVKHEPERSIRLFRLYFANQLSQSDLRRGRASLVFLPITGFYWYDVGPSAPPAARALAGDNFDSWMHSSPFAQFAMPALSSALGMIEGDRRSVEILVVLAAEDLYEREHGKPPPSIEALVGPYVDRIPEGYESEAPLPMDDPESKP